MQAIGRKTLEIRDCSIVLCGGRFTGHLMTSEEDAEMSSLGWNCCVRTEIENGIIGFWEKSVDHDHSREQE